MEHLPNELQDLCGSFLPFSFLRSTCVLVWSLKMGLTRVLLFIVNLITFTVSAPSGFPSSGNGLWYTTPGTVWSLHSLPIGNGYLAATILGGTTQEATQLNIESLWSGGPFADPTYNGGNKVASQQEATAVLMQSIRQTIFQNSSGLINDIEGLTTTIGAYGSYAGAGYLLSTINTSGAVSNYGRWLDLDEGIQRTTWTQGGISFIRESFCSHPAQACVQRTTSTLSTSHVIPSVAYAFSVALESGFPTPNITCLDSSTLVVRGLVADPGMTYEIIGRAQAVGGAITCKALTGSTTPNATIAVSGSTDSWITWVGGTNFDQDAGNAANNFTFQGSDPHASLVSLITAATVTPKTGTTYSALLAQHTADYTAIISAFTLSLGQTPNLNTPTDALVAAYETDTGNVYLEWVLFNYGRHLLASSARGTLPANLQGKWANGDANPWGADYHSNINIQMNYWSAEMSNLNVTQSLFDYFEKNWAPRGALTAQYLYNISRGWVTHDEMNIFGHTGMKADGNDAQWADYPESAVWMMIHVWDHFDYTNDVAWWKAQGWPLLKGVASFHLDKLMPDTHFNDSTLVTCPCNSPEQVPITFGCAHAQQLIWQLFNAVEKGFAASGDTDTAFLAEVTAARTKMDKGIRIGSWGQLQEWKVDMDSPTDTHRHLSHLVGLYPGYAVASYDPSIQGNMTVNGTITSYPKQDVINAATTSLIHRGNGTGPDADSGWEKAWRAASWAQLGNATEYYHILTYAIFENFGPNLFSLYDPFDSDPIFQIDANLGYPAAVLNGLLQAPDVASLTTPLKITLLPALPSAWSTGAIKGARIRGGITISFQWSGGKATSATLKVDENVVSRPVQVVHQGKVVSSFTTSAGLSKTLTF